MTLPKTDIVVLVHNNLPVTQNFTKYLFENTSNFRLIFIDNGSTDSVVEFLKKGSEEKKWTLVRSDENLGVIKGRNLGATYVESEFFMNIDNDQYPKKGWLNKLYNLIEQGYDIVGPEAWSLLPPNCGGSVSIGTKTYKRDYYPYKHCKKPGDSFSYIGCGGMLIKREVYEKIGMFDERYSTAYYEDPDYCFTAIKNGYKIGWSYDCPIDHLEHQTINKQTTFNKTDQFVKSWQKFYEKWYPYYPKPINMVKNA